MSDMSAQTNYLTTAQRVHFGLNLSGYARYLKDLAHRRLMNVNNVQPVPPQPVHKRSMRSLLVSAVSWIKGFGR